MVGMERVLGVETEYGLSARIGGRRLSAPEAAELLFRPVVARHRSANAFLVNGGRLYLDVGSHPEYATPECRTPEELLIAERAGDELMARLAGDASAAAAEQDVDVSFRLFKNNVDAFGNSWGCHENYLVSRQVELSEAVGLLTTFLVTRQVLCGAGRWHRGAFTISQRADHLHAELSALTTRARPLVNTRDEPLADPSRYRRLHVLAGDSNLLETSGWLKVGTMLAVLDQVDRPEGPDARLGALRLADPAGALRQVSHDPLAPLALRDGRRMSAVDLQREHLELAGPAATPGLAALWAEVLDALADREPERVADKVEWVAKRRLLAEFRARHGLGADDPRLSQLDLAFHELGALVPVLEDGGVVARLTDPSAVERAGRVPPADTRARARSAFIDIAGRGGLRFSVDWQTCTLHDPDRRVVLDDPLAVSSPELEAMLRNVAPVRPAPGSGEGLS
jgi:proteasome accessory factor A